MNPCDLLLKKFDEKLNKITSSSVNALGKLTNINSHLNVLNSLPIQDINDAASAVNNAASNKANELKSAIDGALDNTCGVFDNCAKGVLDVISKLNKVKIPLLGGLPSIPSVNLMGSLMETMSGFGSDLLALGMSTVIKSLDGYITCLDGKIPPDVIQNRADALNNFLGDMKLDDTGKPDMTAIYEGYNSDVVESIDNTKVAYSASENLVKTASKNAMKISNASVPLPKKFI
jgi:predicted small secreted protein